MLEADETVGKASGSREGEEGAGAAGSPPFPLPTTPPGEKEVKVGSRAGVLGQLRANAPCRTGGSRNPTTGMGARGGGSGCCCSPGCAWRGRDSPGARPR